MSGWLDSLTTTAHVCTGSFAGRPTFTPPTALDGREGGRACIAVRIVVERGNDIEGVPAIDLGGVPSVLICYEKKSCE